MGSGPGLISVVMTCLNHDSSVFFLLSLIGCLGEGLVFPLFICDDGFDSMVGTFPGLTVHKSKPLAVKHIVW